MIKNEKKIDIFLILVLNDLQVQKTISYKWVFSYHLLNQFLTDVKLSIRYLELNL